MVGTIWTELDETKLYHTINLVEIDKLFSAYQKNGLLVSDNSTLLQIYVNGNLYNLIFLFNKMLLI